MNNWEKARERYWLDNLNSPEVNPIAGEISLPGWGYCTLGGPMPIYIVRERDGSNRKRKIKNPKPYPRHFQDRNHDRMGREFSIAKWRGMTVTWNVPDRLVKHPKDVTRKQRKGHVTLDKYYEAPGNVLQHLDALPRNAPCPYIVRMPFVGDKPHKLYHYVKANAVMEVAYGGDVDLFANGLQYMRRFFTREIPESCSAWRLQWYSWDCPTQVKKSPAFLFAFTHRNLEWDLRHMFDANCTRRPNASGSWI